MEEKINFLLIGKDPVVLQRLLRFVNARPDWQGFGVIDEKSGFALFAELPYYAVILVDYFKESVVETLTEKFKDQKPDIQVLQHFGDSTSLLEAELEDLMKRHPVVSTEEKGSEDSGQAGNNT